MNVAISSSARMNHRTSGGQSGLSRIELRDVHHRFGAREVLRGLNVIVRKGELVGLLSPNGGGKSTTLAILAGLLPLQHGSIAHDGRTLARIDRKYRAQLGVVFQSPSVDQKLTSRQNLQLTLAMHGVHGEAAKQRARECLALAQLSDRADESARVLSGGLRRRLDLVRAIAHQPELLLLDEPTSGLDEVSFRAIWEAIRRLRDESGMSILVATHRPEEAAQCDRLIVIHEGVAVADATPTELVDRMRADMLRIEAENIDSLRTEIERTLQLETRIESGVLHVPCERGHELVVRLVESLPAGRLKTVTLARPTLGDVFLDLTGTSLETELAPEKPNRRSRGSK